MKNHKTKVKHRKRKLLRNGNGNNHEQRNSWRKLLPHLIVVGILTAIIWGYGMIYLGLAQYGSFSIQEWTLITLYWLCFLTVYLVGNELINWLQRLMELKKRPRQRNLIICYALILSSIVFVYAGQWVVFWLAK